MSDSGKIAMRRVSRHLILAVAMIFGGCASVEPGHDYLLGKNPGKGLVVMSLTMTMDAINLDYGTPQGSKLGTFAVDGASKQLDWDDPKGRLIVAELPVGKYELFQWWLSRGQTVQWSHRFSIEFTVIPNKVVYIGNVNFSDVVLGNPRFVDEETKGSFRFSVHDTAKRDIPLFLQRYRNIRESDVQKRIATLGSVR